MAGLKFYNDDQTFSTTLNIPEPTADNVVTMPTSGTVATTAQLPNRNYIINGGFDYWNYAISQTTNGYGSDDRWNNENIGSTKTHSMVKATDTERAVFNSSKFSRTVVTSVAGAGNYTVKWQKQENVTKLAGKTVTVSFWAKADSSKNIAIELYQAFGTGGSPSASITTIGSQLVALTNTWQKKTITITLPSIVGKILGTDGVHTSYTQLIFWFDAGSNHNARTASLGQQSGTFDIAEVKLEEGSFATPWTPYEGEFGGELQACQRYYSTGTLYYESGASSNEAHGASSNTFPVVMRTVPTLAYVFTNLQNASVGATRSVTTRMQARYCLAITSGQSTATETYTASAEL